jgi:fructose 1,6-bisphosphatase
VVVVEGVTATAVPLIAGRFPGVITPVPFAKIPVRFEVPPAVIDVGFAIKLVIVGTIEVTVTVAVCAVVTPAELVTVSV